MARGEPGFSKLKSNAISKSVIDHKLVIARRERHHLGREIVALIGDRGLSHNLWTIVYLPSSFSAVEVAKYGDVHPARLCECTYRKKQKQQ